ncbi:MAG TPA: 50S ribosomal protein L21 [Planctomycetes bacterium]|nr:50S ribosomal protein L21 [Planctomycetota bacterium]
MYAVVMDRNRQHRVSEGDSILLDFNEAWETGQEVVLDQVSLVGGKETRIGTPLVEGARVVLEILGEEDGRKIVVGKFRRRKNYRRKIGFRPKFVRARVKAIEA